MKDPYEESDEELGDGASFNALYERYANRLYGFLINKTKNKVGSSICSNRALIWAYDMKRRYEINTAKMFLFYSEKTGAAGSKIWWYHVTPLVNENGKLWTVDAGFPNFVDTPLTLLDWQQKFAGTTNCKEI